MDSEGRTIWIADAHRDDGKRFGVRADEKLTVFLELESAIRATETATKPHVICMKENEHTETIVAAGCNIDLSKNGTARYTTE